MADMEPSSEKRERILQALSQARRQEIESSGYDSGGNAKSETPWPQKGGRNRPRGGQENRGKSVGDFVCGCVSVDRSVLQHKLIYFMFSAGGAGAIPYLSTFALHLGLPLWHTGQAIAAGILVGAIIAPIWGFLADKLRWHRPMFWGVILVWFGCSVAVAYTPWPVPVSCEMARNKFQTFISEAVCNEVEKVNSDERNISSFFGRYAIKIHTWPDPGTVKITEMCPYDNETDTNTPTDQPYDVRKVFKETTLSWLYDDEQLHQVSLIIFILSVIAGAAQISMLSLTDTSTLMALGEAHRDRYGCQRAFGSLGFALSTLVITIILYQVRSVVSICELEVEFTDYFLGALLFGAFVTVGMLVSGFLQFKHNDLSSHHSLGQVFGVVFSSNYGCVFVTAFVLSFCKGALNTLLSWRIHELGATPVQLITAVVMHGVADLVTSYCIPWLVPRAGYHSPLAAGIVGYCVVYISYAFISRPGWIAVISILEGVSFAITWNMMTSFLASSVALVSQASVQGLLSGVYWGLGPAAGTALFAYLGNLIGDILSFYALTLVCVVYGLVFLIWNRNELPMIEKYLPRDYQQLNRDSED